MTASSHFQSQKQHRAQGADGICKTPLPFQRLAEADGQAPKQNRSEIFQADRTGSSQSRPFSQRPSYQQLLPFGLKGLHFVISADDICGCMTEGERGSQEVARNPPKDKMDEIVKENQEASAHFQLPNPGVKPSHQTTCKFLNQLQLRQSPCRANDGY